jgi:hypothetical protein
LLLENGIVIAKSQCGRSVRALCAIGSNLKKYLHCTDNNIRAVPVGEVSRLVR